MSDAKVYNEGVGVLICAFAPINTLANSRTKMLVHINDGTVMFTFKYCFCSTHMHVSLCSFTKKCKQCDNNGEIMCYATYIFELSGFIFVTSTQQILTQQ